MNDFSTEFLPSTFFSLEEFQHAALFQQCTYIWDALPLIASYLNQMKLGKVQAQIPQTAFLIDPHLISIGEGTVVEPGAFIKGPCIIGRNCAIRHGAYIRGGLIAGDHCVIGHDTEIKNSVLLNHVHAAHFAYVGDSILGNRVNLGAGVKCANLKFDGSEVKIHYQGKKFPTKMRKFGAICGDDVRIGCNAVANPGTLIGKACDCYPCINFGGAIPAYSVVKSNTSILISSKVNK